MTPSKAVLRQAHIAARQAMSPQQRTLADAALITHCRNLAAGRKIAAYAPIGSEPGGTTLVAELAAVAQDVWLPISAADGHLRWARYTGAAQLTPGTLGISEPTGARRDSTVLEELDLILVPALAVDSRGYRLGKGAGYYDRALAGITTPTVAVVYDAEVIDHLPAQSYDVPVGARVCPTGVEPFA